LRPRLLGLLEAGAKIIVHDRASSRHRREFRVESGGDHVANKPPNTARPSS
jgi:hypothetical protein